MPRRVIMLGSRTGDDDLPQIDLMNPKGGVQITVRPDGHRLWVNVDGVCVLRVSGIPILEIEDNREPEAQGEEEN